MSAIFRNDKAIDASIVYGFFNRFATWKVHPRPRQWEKILSNSSAVITAWDDADLIGLARGISDEVRYAQVLEVLVHPDYRRLGIGKELVRRLISDPSMQVRGVNLGTPSMREFYESIGFRCVNDEAYFMVLVRDEFGEDLIQPVEE
jgi:ribosomal protein S18 acetylase RimI-like enzyme